MKHKLICLLLCVVALLAITTTARASAQTIIPNPIVQTVTAGDPVSVTVTYSTKPPDETLTGLGLRVHYNSTALNWDSFSDVFGSPTGQDTAPVEDVGDFDGDPSTDKYLQIAWEDPAGNWPGMGTTPLDLYVANFTSRTEPEAFGPTSINFSASSTPPGYTLNPQSATINVVGNQRIITDPPTQTVKPGDPVSVTVTYSTKPPDETLTGLGLRIHYDSSVLIWDNLSDVYPFGKINQDTSPQDDTSDDFDGDPLTDRYLRVAWADLNGNWPGIGTTPVDLYVANFTSLPSFTGTTSINFSAITTPPYWELNPQSATISKQLGEAPTDIGLDPDPASVDENADGAVIGNVTVTDPDVGDTHTLTVDDARFEIVGGQLKLKAGQSLDHETEPSVDVDITATDAGGLTLTETFTITVNDVAEGPPSVPATFTFNVDEDAAIGTVVGQVVANPNDGSILNYFPMGDISPFLLTFTGTAAGTLTLNGPLDHATTPTYQFMIGVVPDPYAFLSTTVTINVKEPNQDPTANAGPDQTVHSGTQITLDGSGSFDPDGDPLTYCWYLNGQIIATGVSPTIQLPAGVHVIDLIVNDGTADSQPDHISIIVVQTTGLDIYPNRMPNQVFLSRNYTLYVAVLGSADFDVTNIDSSSVLFGRTGTEACSVRAPIVRDLSGDGFLDAMYGFQTFDCGFQIGDTEGWLTGFTEDGIPLEGGDSVLVSP